MKSVQLNESVEAIDLDEFDNLSIAQTSYDVFRILKAYSHKTNYSKFIFLRMPDSDDKKIADLTIVTNWDPELIARYDMMGLILDSPIFNTLRKSMLPYVWQLENLKHEETQKLFSEYNISNGVYFRVSGVSGQRGIMGLSGQRQNPTRTELMEMSFFANHAFEALCKLDIMQTKNVDTLTEREKQCIHWTAYGKTSSEVGSILKISDNTVNNYLASAAIKLETSNKAHTVAKAIQFRLLDNL